MRELVAVVLPPGPAFVDRLRQAWDDGDAVLPVDTRLPPAARDRLLDTMRPTRLVGPDGDEALVADGEPVEAGDALVVATSGSTGPPKGVVFTHAAVEASARASSDRLGVDPERDTWLACLPVAHVGGLSVITRALVTDTPLATLPAFDAAAVTGAAEQGATLVSLVPTALARIDPARFRCILLGGSAPPPDRPANVVATYGLTETGSGCVYDGVALDGVEVRVADGEVQVRGPVLLRAYRDGTDPRTADGWLATGDLGELDANGHLVVHGRRGDLIITGGENVWPAPVEAALASHHAVADVAVIGRPDADWGQRVVAVVVPTDGADPPTLAELRGYVKEQLPAYAAPREIELVAALPRTALGKVVRASL